MTIDYVGEGASLRITETANARLWVLLVDTTDLFHCCTNLGDQAGRGSSTDKVSQIDLDDPMTAPAEAAAVAVTDPAVASVTIAIARQALRRQETDLHALTGAPGMYRLNDPELLSLDARNSIVIRRSALITALFAGLATEVGATGVDLSVTNIYQAMFQLQLNRNPQEPGGPCCVLHPQQFNDFQESLRGEAGAVQFQAATDRMLYFGAPGFYGEWHGLSFWTSDQVPTVNAGADRGGAMFTHGCFGYKEASAAQFLRRDAGSAFLPVPEFSPAFIELVRTPASALFDAVFNYYAGVVEIEDLRGVEIITDA